MIAGAVTSIAAGQVLRALWYSRFLFGNVWFKYQFPCETPEPGVCFCALALTFAGHAILTLLFSYIIPMFEVTCVVTAVQTGLGLAALIAIADVPHLAFNRRSFVVYFIDHAFDAALMAIMAASVTFFL